VCLVAAAKKKIRMNVMDTTRRIQGFLVLLAAGIVLKATYLFASDIWRVDLFYYIQAARAMLDGGVLYTNFGCSHPPLGYFEFFWLAKWFGYDNMYWTLKISAIVIQTFTAFFVFLIIGNREGFVRGMISSIVLLVMLSINSRLWPHNIPFTFLLPAFAGIYFIVKNDFQPNALQLFLFGFFWSCATLISTNVIFYTLLVPFLTVKNHGFRISKIISEGTAAFTGFLVPVIAFFLYFYYNNALGDWHFWNITWASTYAGFKPWYMKAGFFFFGFLVLWQWLPFTGITVYGIVRAVRAKLYRENTYVYFVLAVLFCAMLSKIIMNKSNPRYYLYMLPGLIFGIDYGISLLEGNVRKYAAVCTAIFVIVALSLTNYTAWSNPYDRSFDERKNLKKWIVENVPRDNTLWVWDEGYEIYYETKRKMSKTSFFSAGEFLDKVKLWRYNNFRNGDLMWERFLKEFKASPPDYIVDLRPDFGQSNGNPRTGLHKKYFDDFYTYVTTHYRVIADIDGRQKVYVKMSIPARN